MDGSNSMKRLCDLYIRRVTVIGALYCIIPTLVWFLIMFAQVAFRQVYLVRLVLSLVVGGAFAALVNRYGLSLWLAKHRSKDGPATVADGMLIGAAVGLGTALVPPLTGLIRSNHIEMAKTFIICAWLLAAVIGAIIGGILASIGVNHVDRTGSE